MRQTGKRMGEANWGADRKNQPLSLCFLIKRIQKYSETQQRERQSKKKRSFKNVQCWWKDSFLDDSNGEKKRGIELKWMLEITHDWQGYLV